MWIRKYLSTPLLMLLHDSDTHAVCYNCTSLYRNTLCIIWIAWSQAACADWICLRFPRIWGSFPVLCSVSCCLASCLGATRFRYAHHYQGSLVLYRWDKSPHLHPLPSPSRKLNLSEFLPCSPRYWLWRPLCFLVFTWAFSLPYRFTVTHLYGHLMPQKAWTGHTCTHPSQSTTYL